MWQAPTSHPFSLSQGAFPCQATSASAAPPAPAPEHSPDPKGDYPPQTLWTACLWAGPHPRQPQKGPLAPNSERSHLVQGAQAEPLRSIQPGH